MTVTLHKPFVLGCAAACLAIFMLPQLAARAQDKDKIPPPENVSLETRDHVVILATYFASNKGKKAAPIIILPGWEGRRTQFGPLALALQKQGYAVIVADLRGQGGSIRRRVVGGQDIAIKRDKMRTGDLEAMVLDVRTVKKFLMKEHRAGKLNIDLLCVIGSELGALVAMNWAMLDGNWPDIPVYKRVRNVRALVLISPETSFKGLRNRTALASPVLRSQLSVMIIAGKKGSAYSDAKRIHGTLTRYRAPVPDDKQERLRRQDLFLITRSTSLQGVKLINARIGVDRDISGFLQLRLLAKADDYPWKKY